MDSLHVKRFIVLAVTTLVVIAVAVVGLLVMNDEMQKALIHTQENVYSTNQPHNTDKPSADDIEEKW